MNTPDPEITIRDGHECVVLAAMMNGTDALPVTAEDFSSPPNRIIFNRIIPLENRGLLAVTDALRRNGELDKVGGPGRIAEIATTTHDGAVLNYSLDEVLEYSRAQQAAKIGERLHKREIDPGEALKQLESLNWNTRRPHIDIGRQGSAVEFPDVVLWETPVNGADVLSKIAATFSRYLALPVGAADVLALWTAHAHAFEAFVHTPRLNLCSPDKGCGKTTALDVLASVTPRPLRTESMTAAVLFRLVEQYKPTLLLDEVDAYLNEAEELRGLLNAGHKRGAKAYRCEGENNTVRGFAAFAPAALAGIGALPGTLHDRSNVIKLVRAKPGEIVARFDSRRIQTETELCRKLARWTADKFDQLKNCDPQLPENAFNRLADNWRPLFAIAEAAGADWPQRVCSAFTALTATADLDAQGVGTMLLSDIAVIFAAKDRDKLPSLEESLAAIEAGEAVDKLPSATLAARLAEIEGRPWAEWGRHRKPISTNQLANQLRRFGISPRGIRVGDETPRGYLLDDFKEVFSRFLSNTPSTDCNSATTLGKTPISEVQQAETVLHPEKELLQRECCTVAPQNPPTPRKGDKVI